MSDNTIPVTAVKLISLLAPLVSLTTSATILSFSFLQAPILREIGKDDPVNALKHIRWYFETGEFTPGHQPEWLDPHTS